jgi:hypothetical protein
MSKKKTLTKMDIISLYMEYISTYACRPNSIEDFSDSHNFDDAIFYEHFKSFKALEKTIFNIFFTNTMALLEKSEEYQYFDQRDKVLSFYYTFFEILTANRDFVLQLLKAHKTNLKTLGSLSKLKKSYMQYIHSLNIETIDLKQETLNSAQDKSLEKSAWIQLLLTFKFWADDTSQDLEKTDVFIEKLVNTGFDLINTKPLKSLIDLGKFIIKEKIHF